MLSDRGRKQLVSDRTPFFYNFIDETHLDHTGEFDLRIGNIRFVPKVMEALSDHANEIEQPILRLSGFYPGCQGLRSLNEKIAVLYEKETGEYTSSEQIVMTNGALDGLYHALFVFCNAGDKVCYNIPNFPFWPTVDRTETKSLFMYFRDAEKYSKGFSEVFSRVLGENKVSALIVSSPSNPFGVEINKTELIKLNAMCSNTQVIVDNVYGAFAENNAAKYFNNKVVIDSFSKRFGFPGLRLGWARLQEEHLKYFRASLANQVVGVSVPALVIADKMLDIFSENKLIDCVVKEMHKRQSVISKELRQLRKYNVNFNDDVRGIYRVLDFSDFIKDNGLSKKDVMDAFEGKVKVLDCSMMMPPGNIIAQDSFFVRLCVGPESRIKEAGQAIVEVVEGLVR